LTSVTIDRIGTCEGGEVTIKGWLYNRRSSGKVQFLIIRDGTGFLQAVAVRSEVGEELFHRCDAVTQESAVVVTGRVRSDARAPGGYELALTGLELVHLAEEYPLRLKEHGVDFLLEHRHLWLRTPRQVAIMRIRAKVISACRQFLDDLGFVLMDAPVLTPSACEGTTTLFETAYFDERAYLTQSGQLYNEAAAMALGRVYCFGPAFRAEKSKTRRHLIEFWMLEPEAAYLDFEENMALQEAMVCTVVRRVLEEHTADLQALERDPAPLRAVTPPFPRITYDRALELVSAAGRALPWGEDFGAPDESAVSHAFDRPVFVTHFPTRVKAFYMQPDPDRPEVVLGADLLAPEGYGEIIGGGQRIHERALLEARIAEHGLPADAYRWYVDLRRYGSVPHSGFGLGIERTVAWMCGLDHVREAIPFPRMLNRIYP
jgi:asparaginyl-tRNA synthetase